MLRYEKDMNQLRALALWAAQDALQPTPGLQNPRDYVIGLIGHYSRQFAQDIKANSSINPSTLDLFHSSLFTINKMLGISDNDIDQARIQQLYANSGFWEMRRYLGQFFDMAEYSANDSVTHIVSAAVSGCIVAEYLKIHIEDVLGEDMPTDHMIFARIGVLPVKGLLRSDFKPEGDHILLIDDAVMETRTLRVMKKTLEQFNIPKISVLTVDIEPSIIGDLFMRSFYRVYLFEE